MQSRDATNVAPLPMLYVSTAYDEEAFREGPADYWLPNVGQAAFHANAAAAKDAADAGVDSDTPESIFLSNVALHTKTSYHHFYDRFGGPPAQVSFDRPVLVLYEHEAEDPRWREGAGFTTVSAAVCLPNALRDRIAAALRLRSVGRWIVIGFPHERFALPQSRTIAAGEALTGQIWIVEAEVVEIAVF